MTQYPDIMAILRVCLTVTYLLGMGESTYGDRDFWRFGWCDVVMLVTSKVWGGKKKARFKRWMTWQVNPTWYPKQNNHNQFFLMVSCFNWMMIFQIFTWENGWKLTKIPNIHPL